MISIFSGGSNKSNISYGKCVDHGGDNYSNGDSGGGGKNVIVMVMLMAIVMVAIYGGGWMDNGTDSVMVVVMITSRLREKTSVAQACRCKRIPVLEDQKYEIKKSAKEQKASLTMVRAVGDLVNSKSALRSAGILLSWVRASPPLRWRDKGPGSLKSS
ncbi:hypothetical protein PoB_004825700 [Plakobranchus ocellatus]|uniref:Uncharacterized protein n=1 Tax=Plakobranchus ocellatus TaxID=259542 RepID=A0AAV4BRZ4_9GAST|nr:hypothetical protein PoB_004825700 [Plakobranchus ocellatus]